MYLKCDTQSKMKTHALRVRELDREWVKYVIVKVIYNKQWNFELESFLNERIKKRTAKMQKGK